MSNIMPGVMWTDANGNDRYTDLPTRLLKDRIIILEGEINPEMATGICEQLLYLESENKEKPIKMLIQSPGGDVDAGWSIIDTMNMVKCPVATVVQGCVASMASVIAVSGTKGMRTAMPHANVMLHTVASGARGKVQDMKIDYEQAEKANTELFKHLSKCLGQPLEKLKKDCDRDFWMTAEEWKKYGGCDEIKKSNKK